MRTGDLILFKPENIFSRLISILDGSGYSHIGVIYGEVYGEVLINHVDEGNSKLVSLSSMRDRDYDVYRVKGLRDSQLEEVQEEIINQLGVEYDILQLLSYLLKILQIGRLYNNKKKYVCIELIDVIFSKLGFDLIPTQETGYVTLNNLIKSGNIFKIG